MSRAFVKEQETEQDEKLAELPLSPHPNYVTPRGLELLQQRLAAVRQRLVASDKDAFGAELERALIEREMRWLAARIGSALPIAPEAQPCDRVTFGATVEMANVDGDGTRRYRIVGEDEADPERGLVSWVSPLARALRGATVGDVVVWPRPAGDVELEVLGIVYDVE